MADPVSSLTVESVVLMNIEFSFCLGSKRMVVGNSLHGLFYVFR